MKTTVQRALNELKTLDNRLEKRLSDFIVIGTKKNGESRVSETRESIEDFAVRAKSNLDSANDLLKRKRLLKKAIMESSAKTMIVVAGVEYSVMEAIDRKRTIENEKYVLDVIKRKFNSAEYEVSKSNRKMEEYIQDYTTTMASGDMSNKKSDFVVAFEKSYREANEWQLVDPLNLRKLIEEMEKEIEEFELEIDTALTISNATTVIEISE